MNKALLAGLLLAGLTGGFADAAEPSACTRLADEASRAPPATWAQADPLSAWIKPSQPAKPSPTVAALANDARWRSLLGASESQPMGVQQLGGAPVYLIDEFAGTAHCQSLVLVEAQPGRPPRQLKPPFDLERLNLCTTQSAAFARVLGQPAFVVGGAPSVTSPDLHYRIATWTGQGWGQRCSVKLRRHTAMTVAQRFCPPGSEVCDAGEPVARRLAQAYEAARLAGRPLDAQGFDGGARPDAAVAAALKPLLAEPGAIGDMNPPFPLFGADEKGLDPMLTGFSNADLRVLPVRVGARWWLAVVGRAGVGWREGDALLVALFAPPGRAADGVASYQFRIGPTGMRDAVSADEPH
ncbi:hypothetical protein [Pelomonas sp. Root1444]|uniref:hypothetical protein n=1 Tax=Pelomonas sp. Root1444 TaxID=1736464 RepID=UPI0007034EEA|nr:hypothetical protein [Pelomonas sp. Root1444]KQY81123.1 hypothetical protein ASD35_04615 [Pelomonas sp. Root1444]